MILSDELITKLKDDPYFAQYAEYVYLNILELNSIKDFVSVSVQEAGELAKARATAIGILEKILAPFVEFNNKKGPSEDEIKAAKVKFGL